MSASNGQPPKWADQFLEWFCHPDLLEEIQGDVYELFEKRQQEHGTKNARRNFIWDVCRSFRWSTIRNFNSPISAVMFKSNFKIAFRQISKQKLFSVIKIGGFALGIAACLLISLFIVEELSYDQHYVEKDRIYRVLKHSSVEGEPADVVWFPAPLASALEKEFPEVEKAGRIRPGTSFDAGSNQIRRTDQKRNTEEEGFVYADPNFIDILEVKMVDGELKNALSEPRSMVISKSKADKFFPDENAVGQTMILNDDPSSIFTIGGVMENFPENAHLNFDFLMTLEKLELFPGDSSTWQANNYHVYVRLHDEVDVAALESKMVSIIDDYYIPSRQAAGEVDALDIAGKWSLNLQPVTDIYLKSGPIYDLLPHGDIRLVWIFGGVAFFILLLACINFINLSTAKSANRAKEVGLRKVVGSQRNHLIFQFLTESVLFSLLALVVGVILAEIFLPYFNHLADKQLIFPWQEWWLVPTLILMTLMIGIIAGLYPALYLSKFQPIHVLQGHLSKGSKSSKMRNALVVFQFSTSIVLLIGTFVIYQQLEFILNTKLGFEKDQVVILKGTNTLMEKIPTLKKELLNLKEVEEVSVSDYLPISGTRRNSVGYVRKGKKGLEATAYGQRWIVDHDYISTLGIQIKEGRDFSIEMPSDSQAVIMNERMVERFGFKNPVGQDIENGGRTLKVIGVVENFHFETLKEEVQGLCLMIGNSSASMSLKVNTSDMAGLIKTLTNTWNQFSPNQPIRYSFMDERFASMYADVQRTRSIFVSFALLAIIIACLGLFALSSFMTEQRSKEISIRKVLGASTSNILRLLTQNFIVLILISLVIASPIAWYLMQKWLADFAYSIEVTWHVFAFAGISSIVIAFITIGYQAYRTATMAPVEALRN